MSLFSSISEWLHRLFSKKNSLGSDDTNSEDGDNRERIIAFSIAFFISVCLWFIVNLSRDFNVNIQVPIQVAEVPEDRIVSSNIPESATVNVSGEGWNIISVYNNPPNVFISAEDEEVNLTDYLRNQISAFSDINIIQVQPTQITIRTEEKVTKKVPVVSNIALNMRKQFGLLRGPEISPDSVIVSGTTSAIDTLNQWATEQLQINNLDSDIQRSVSLEEPAPGISLDIEAVNFQVWVAEFTEAEARVPIRTINLPAGRAVTYNPSSVTVRFDVPIDQYSQIQDLRLFQASVDYTILEDDDSGRVEPEIETLNTEYNIRLRSHQPERVSYFRIVPE